MIDEPLPRVRQCPRDARSTHLRPFAGRSSHGLARSVREVIILMADLDDGATPELTFTYEVSDEGYSVRDAAALLGLTPGRVPQLLNA
jgi:hypothetical protein